ncbi:hypothetical protein M885DRAFT_528335 [Pelagophyceae sp. CCMP2097]|nr:hypothetical protein M885DRAFT_528335 [Pelagophyceae sp. CCMP2097]
MADAETVVACGCWNLRVRSGRMLSSIEASRVAQDVLSAPFGPRAPWCVGGDAPPPPSACPCGSFNLCGVRAHLPEAAHTSRVYVELAGNGHAGARAALRFDAVGALRRWARLSASGARRRATCSAASNAHWRRVRAQAHALGDGGTAVAREPAYDWTYETDYVGCLGGDAVEAVVARATSPWGRSAADDEGRAIFDAAGDGYDGEDADDGVDPASKESMAAHWRVHAPVFSQEVPLVEDLLHDNGISRISVCVVVTNVSWFVLVRSLRAVLGQLATLRDARYFGRCDSPIIRRALTASDATDPKKVKAVTLAGEPENSGRPARRRHMPRTDVGLAPVLRERPEAWWKPKWLRQSQRLDVSRYFADQWREAPLKAPQTAEHEAAPTLLGVVRRASDGPRQLSDICEATSVSAVAMVPADGALECAFVAAAALEDGSAVLFEPQKAQGPFEAHFEATILPRPCAEAGRPAPRIVAVALTADGTLFFGCANGAVHSFEPAERRDDDGCSHDDDCASSAHERRPRGYALILSACSQASPAAMRLVAAGGTVALAHGAARPLTIISEGRASAVDLQSKDESRTVVAMRFSRGSPALVAALSDGCVATVSADGAGRFAVRRVLACSEAPTGVAATGKWCAAGCYAKAVKLWAIDDAAGDRVTTASCATVRSRRAAASTAPSSTSSPRMSTAVLRWSARRSVPRASSGASVGRPSRTRSPARAPCAASSARPLPRWRCARERRCWPSTGAPRSASSTSEGRLNAWRAPSTLRRRMRRRRRSSASTAATAPSCTSAGSRGKEKSLRWPP